MPTDRIVFVHGAGLSGRSWQPIVERLPEFHCLTPDLPGHGRQRNGRFGLEHAAMEIAGLARDQSAGHRAHVVGLSLGGAVVLTLLRVAPDVVDHAIITGSSGRVPGWLMAVSSPLLALTRLVRRQYLVRSTLRQLRIPELYHPLLHDDLLDGTDPAFLRGIFRELRHFEPPGSIDRPLLVAAGKAEPGASRLYGRIALRSLRAYPSARGVLMPGGGHLWPLQFPDAFAEMVRAFVTDRPLPAVLETISI